MSFSLIDEPVVDLCGTQSRLHLQFLFRLLLKKKLRFVFEMKNLLKDTAKRDSLTTTLSK